MEQKPTGDEAGERQAAIKLAIEIGPLLLFFLVYVTSGIYPATIAIMVATVASVAASMVKFKKVSPVPVVTTALLCLFGALTLWFDDPRFLYHKPTAINLLLAVVLAGGMLTGRPIVRLLLGGQLQLTDEGWRKLTLRWTLFFFALAALNELVVYANGLNERVLVVDAARKAAEQRWVYFKVFAILPLTFVFAAAQIGLLKKHQSTN
jgi:intracellular septation protein